MLEEKLLYLLVNSTVYYRLLRLLCMHIIGCYSLLHIIFDDICLSNE